MPSSLELLFWYSIVQGFNCGNDASAWIAVTNVRDKFHRAAADLYRRLVTEGLLLVTTNPVIAEAYVVIRRMGGHEPATRFLRTMRGTARLRKVYSNEQLELEAERLLERFSDQDFGLTDAVSFVVMKQCAMEEVFGFDDHFVTAGFRRIP